MPAPKDKFILMLRMYWPKEKPPSIIDGTWKVSMFIPDATPEEAYWFNELERVSTSPEGAARLIASFGGAPDRGAAPGR